jgi:hypothetical protein
MGTATAGIADVYASDLRQAEIICHETSAKQARKKAVQTSGQTGRHLDRQTDILTDRQTSEQTGRHLDRLIPLRLFQGFPARASFKGYPMSMDSLKYS